MCEHLNFASQVRVLRLSDVEGGPVTGYTAEIKIHCVDCKRPFQFMGLEPGVDTQGARVSVDGIEARMAIFPDGQRPSPLQRMAFDIDKFDA